jgi:cyclophilin family peptidyl-prolyl cis-trans isomerase
MGDITFTLDPKQAPATVNNFVFLSKQGFYDGVTFHRVIPGFMIQGGDPTGTGSGGPGYSFKDELPKSGQYKIGSVAMANAGPNTNGSQFFIVTGPNGVALPPLYSLFGQVTKGQDVAEAISNVPRDATDKPNTPVTIDSVTITESGTGK